MQDLYNEEELAKIQQIEPLSLSLENEVFHILGSPEYIWVDDSYVKQLPNRNALYDLIEKKGGRLERLDKSPYITCVVVGARPSRKLVDYYLGKVKFIRAEAFVAWIKQFDDTSADDLTFDNHFIASEDPRLRSYQQQLKNEVFRAWKTYYHIMLQLPTGTGKTVLFTSIIEDLEKVADTKILILAHRKELIEQISDHLSHYHIQHGIIASGVERHLEYSVQVASIQMLSHANNRSVMKKLNPQVIIIDEAHHSLAKTYTRFWEEFEKSWKLGVTATPYRLNLKPFKTHFGKLIESNDIETFIDQGYLAQYDFYTDNPHSELSRTIQAIKEKSSTQDYVIATLMEKLNVPEHIQRLVMCYEQYAKGKKGLIYAINREHARNICEAYLSIGVKAEYVDGETPKQERQKIVESFRRSEIQIMVNVDIFSEGFDCPDIEFIQLARPSWSLGKYLQQLGRGMRPSENKQKIIILDNSRMFVKFGLPSTKRTWQRYFSGITSKALKKKSQGIEIEEYVDILLSLSSQNEDMMIKIGKDDILNYENGKKEQALIAKKLLAEEKKRLNATNKPPKPASKPRRRWWHHEIYCRIGVGIAAATVSFAAVHFLGLLGFAVIGIIAALLVKK